MDSHRSIARVLQLSLGCLLSAASPALASADSLTLAAPEQHSGPPAPPEPPAFAFEACADKQEGARCSVTLSHRTLEGACVVSRDERLFCMPDDMAPPPRHGEHQDPSF